MDSFFNLVLQVHFAFILLCLTKCFSTCTALQLGYIARAIQLGLYSQGYIASAIQLVLYIARAIQLGLYSQGYIARAIARARLGQARLGQARLGQSQARPRPSLDLVLVLGLAQPSPRPNLICIQRGICILFVQMSINDSTVDIIISFNIIQNLMSIFYLTAYRLTVQWYNGLSVHSN